MAEPVLCFIDETDTWAWFTTCPLADQPGGKWWAEWRKDNADEPGEWGAHMDIQPYELTVVGFRDVHGHWWTPDNCSVDSINSKLVAWLRPTGNDIPLIYAGTPLSEFKRIIREHGGEIYTRED